MMDNTNLNCKVIQLPVVAIAIVVLAQTGLSGSAGELADKTPPGNPWTLYKQQKYTASSDAFEPLIRTSKPSATLYYYAALANVNCGRSTRAKQLCQYIITNFAGTTEAAYAQKLFPDVVAAKTTASSDALPASLKGKNVQELMKTEEGRKAVEEALAKKEAASAAAAKVSPMLAKSMHGRPGDRVFTTAEIAKDGAGGIDQMYYPNCWFESSMSALAMLPRGQRLMADMIRYGDKEGHYVVRFPGDGVEYKITEEALEKSGVHNKALWATLIECGQTLKFPEDAGGELADGLGCLTGQRAETITPSSASPQELSSFIEGAVKSQNPIICGSNYSMRGLPILVFPSHAYAIIGFDPASGMITIRNPHGINSERFTLPNDEKHQKFEQLNDGVFKMHISLFPHYFSEAARSFI